MASETQPEELLTGRRGSGATDIRDDFQTGPAIVRTAGGMRTRTPGQTLELIAPHLASVGVTRVADVTGLDCIGIPVFTAHRPNGKSLAVSQGKGVTRDAARASAVMEAVELYHAENVAAPLYWGSAAEMARRGRLIDLDRLPRLLGAEIPLRRETLWIEGHELRGGGARLVPFDLVHTDFSRPMPPALGCFLQSSNGLASGNTPEEAQLHALCETVERDAIALWRAGHQQPQDLRIDPESVTDPSCRALLDRFRQTGVLVAIWSLGRDLGIPAFFVTIIDADPESWRSLYAASGSGAHPDRGIALARALSEAAQSRLTLISGVRDDRVLGDYRSLQARQRIRKLHAEIAEMQAARRFDSVATLPASDIGTATAFILDALTAAGLGAPVTVDLSRAELPVAVVRVIVPGLEGPSDAPGYTPGARAIALSAAS